MRIKYMDVFTFLLFVSNFSFADSEGKNQAEVFAKLYASLCLKNLNNLDSLREKLKPAPQLPPDKETFFLAGLLGKAWPVPSKYGKFVLAIPSAKSFCAVHVQKADTEIAKQLFTQIVANTPTPLVSKQVSNQRKHTAANGDIQTISYEWAIPKAARKCYSQLLLLHQLLQRFKYWVRQR